MSIFGNTSGAFVKWDTPKTVVGTITGFRVGRDFDDTRDTITVDLENEDGDEFSINVAQARLAQGIDAALKTDELGDLPNVPAAVTKLNETRIGVKLGVDFRGSVKVEGYKFPVKDFVVEAADAATAAAAAPASLL